MNVSFRVWLCSLVWMLTLGAGTLSAGEAIMVIPENGDLATSFGVNGIAVDEINDWELHLTALGSSEEIAAIAQIVLPGGMNATSSIVIWTDDATLGVHWCPPMGLVELKNLETDQSGEIRLSLLGDIPAWINSPVAEDILARHSHNVMFAAALLSFAEKEWNGTTDDTTGDMRSMGNPDVVDCVTGQIKRGFGMDSSRAWCCWEAHQDADLKCANQWCDGCCRWWECDACCALGDYFCFCGKTGRACSAEDVPD